MYLENGGILVASVLRDDHEAACLGRMHAAFFIFQNMLTC